MLSYYSLQVLQFLCVYLYVSSPVKFRIRKMSLNRPRSQTCNINLTLKNNKNTFNIGITLHYSIYPTVFIYIWHKVYLQWIVFPRAFILLLSNILSYTMVLLHSPRIWLSQRCFQLTGATCTCP